MTHIARILTAPVLDRSEKGKPPRPQILDHLKGNGDQESADQAQSELPDKVDTEKDSGLLGKFGINPQDLMGKLGGLGG